MEILKYEGTKKVGNWRTVSYITGIQSKYQIDAVGLAVNRCLREKFKEVEYTLVPRDTGNFTITFKVKGILNQELNALVLVPIKDIKISNRFRKEFEDDGINRLAKDIERNGLTHPITINADKRLICGERRLRAMVVLGRKEIPCSIRGDLNTLQERALEINENILRHDFTWWEAAYAIREFHSLRQKEFGQAKRGSDEGWGLEETGEELQCSHQTVKRALDLAYYLDKYPEAIKECKGAAAAVKYVKEFEGRKLTKEKARRDLEKAQGEEGVVVERAEGEEIRPVFVHADAVEWLPDNITTPMAHLLFIDPPYGIDAHKKTTVAKTHGEHYDDTSGFAWRMAMTDLLQACYDVALDGAHAYLFFGMVRKEKKDGEDVPESLHARWVSILNDSEWHYDPLPLIWSKGETGGAGRMFEYDYFAGYEPIFFLTKGYHVRPFNVDHRRNSNVLPVFPVPKNKIHPAHKPRGIYDYFIKVSGLEGGVMIDPCAGSGESGLAAIDNGITPILIERGEDEFGKMVVHVGTGGI